MDDINETARILSSEAQDELILQRDDEISKILKLRMVLQQLAKIRIKDLKLPDGGERVEHVLKVLRVAEFLKLGSHKDDYLLNLGHCLSGELSYIERKAVRQQLLTDLQKKLHMVEGFAQKLNIQFPELLNKSTFSTEVARDTALQRILTLEKERCQKLEKLAILRNRKCGLLKMAAELKMGPHLEQKLELLYAQARLNQTKANVLYGYLTNELMSRSEHTFKALREVEVYINEALDSLEEQEQN